MTRVIIVSAALLAIVVACSSGESGGPVTGAADTHCTLPDGGVKSQPINLASCTPTGGDAGTIDYGPTLYNAEADDDDCKYHVRFNASDIKQNENANFNVVATIKSDGGPATAAKLDIEAFLNDTHPAPNSGQHTVEGPPGTYNIGPVKFDAPGQWTVRFHLHEDCADQAADSPHGHVAFFIHVP